jgi:hypothetical protein
LSRATQEAATKANELAEAERRLQRCERLRQPPRLSCRGCTLRGSG